MNNCIYCGNKLERENVLQGLIIKGSCICFQCEQQIKSINVNDEKYDFYIKGLKKIWRCLEL